MNEQLEIALGIVALLFGAAALVSVLFPRLVLGFSRLGLGPIALRIYAVLFLGMIFLAVLFLFFAIDEEPLLGGAFTLFFTVLSVAFAYLLRREGVPPLKKLPKDIFE